MPPPSKKKKNKKNKKQRERTKHKQYSPFDIYPKLFEGNVNIIIILVIVIISTFLLTRSWWFLPLGGGHGKCCRKTNATIRKTVKEKSILPQQSKEKQVSNKGNNLFIKSLILTCGQSKSL
jgi:hypothetical protein